VGKTTLARIIANETGSAFEQLSAVSAGKADVRAIVERAAEPQTSLNEALAVARKKLVTGQTVFFWMKYTDLIKPNKIFYCRTLKTAP
jgi:hypothetical protein